MKALLACVVVLVFELGADAQWVRQTVATSASLRGLSVVNEKVVWASGTGGTVIRTIDGGKTWKVIIVPGAEKLDFRDIEAFDANTAYILSIGNGESSRIYKTVDGGQVWTEQFRSRNEKAFFDAIACRNSEYCIAMSDPVDGEFLLIETSDGKTWDPMRAADPPRAKSGEAAFAASGTSLITMQIPYTMFVTGGSDSRVFRSYLPGDGGWMWEAVDSGITKGSSGSGIFSIAMYDFSNGVIVGGNYEKPNEVNDNLAFTTDGAKTWKLATGLSGYRSGVTYVNKKTIIAVGTNGSDITRNGGKTWKLLGKEDLNAVQSKGKKATWAVGPKGLVVKMK